jgi:allantoinase
VASGDWSIGGLRVVFRDGVGPAVIRIRGGNIVGVERRAPSAGEVTVDAGSDIVMAGLVDSHVHVNEPGRTEWEGFASATRAAAAGGVTTIIDMPLNSIPATTSVAGLEAKVAAASGKSAIDFGLWGGAVPGNEEEIPRLAAAGVLGFKCFMTPSGVAEFEHVDEAALRSAMKAIAGIGGVLLAHAEAPDVIDAALGGSGLRGRPRSYRAYLASRPAAAEVAAVEILVRLCRETGCRTHIVHVSAAEALPVIAAAKAEGLPLTAETCPHYLCIAAEEIADGATQFKCAPPIRDSANRERLWAALADGTLDMIVSDHSPCPPEMKRLESGSFAEAWGGIASVQFGLGLVWNEARARGFGEREVARWMCEAPAALAGLDRVKGSIDVGYDADLVIWNPDRKFVVEARRVLHRHAVTPYIGRTLWGAVERVYLRGECVVDSRGVSTSAAGRWLRGSGGA